VVGKEAAEKLNELAQNFDEIALPAGRR